MHEVAPGEGVLGMGFWGVRHFESHTPERAADVVVVALWFLPSLFVSRYTLLCALWTAAGRGNDVSGSGCVD